MDTLEFAGNSAFAIARPRPGTELTSSPSASFEDVGHNTFMVLNDERSIH